MPGGYGLRFALEAGFLILLAAASAVADLRTAVIVAIVAGGWLIVCLVEWLAWRAGPVPLRPAFPAAPAPSRFEPSGAHPRPAGPGRRCFPAARRRCAGPGPGGGAAATCRERRRRRAGRFSADPTAAAAFAARAAPAAPGAGAVAASD